MYSHNKSLSVVICFFCMSCFALSGEMSKADSRPTIKVFYKEKAPSMETCARIRTFLDTWKNNFSISYFLITDKSNHKMITELKLPIEHFPFALAINGKTSAEIDGQTIVFAHFPDFMHHIGKHRGNWTLEHLEKVLRNTDLLLPDNPKITSNPGGSEPGK